MNKSWKTLRAKLSGAQKDFDQELNSEIDAHLQIEIDQNVAAGMSPEQARSAAFRTFGNVLRIKERTREAWSFAWLDALLYDLRFAARALRKNPGFAAVAVLTLTLGIGATAAIFSVVNTVLLKSLPYPEADRLVVLDEYKVQHGSRTVSWLDFEDWSGQVHAFQNMAGYRLSHLTLTGAQEPTLLRAAEISSPFFHVLGVQPLLGRTFGQADDKAGAPRTVVVSYAFWRNTLHGDPSLTGKALNLNGMVYAVIGVLPPDFNFFDKRVDIYLPIGLHGDDPIWNRRGFHPDMLVLARLARGVSLESARSQMNTVMSRLDQQYPHSDAGMLASVTPLYQYRFGSIRPILLMLFAAVACVLLIGTANVANLLLARSSSRAKELAIRVALGAGAGRLIRQLLTESLLLSLIGAVTGLLCAFAGLRLILRLAPQSIPRISATSIDARVVLFALVTSVVSGILFGTIPALHASRVDMNTAFKENSRGTGTGRAGKRVRASLMISEAAFALVLIMASGLLIRSLINANNVDPGFRPARTLGMDVMLTPTKYTDAAQQAIFYSQAVQRLRSLPGVEQSGAAFCPPLVGVCASNAFSLADQPVNSVADLPTAAFNIVVPGYFETLKVPLLQGKFFTDSDSEHSQLVAIVNQSFARRWWPNASPIGKLIKEGGPERNEPYREVVGVVADIKQDGVDGEQHPEVFFPLAQYPFAPWDSLQAMTFVVRTKGNPTAIIEPAKNAIWAVDKDVPLTAVQPFTEYRAEALARREFSTVLLGTFGVLALVLAAVGIYGVMAYNVNQQRHEIGTRIALGAQITDIRKLVLGETALLILEAVALGLAGSWICARWIKGLLFGITTYDPLTLCAVCAILGLVAMFASYVPMRRATSVDPVTTLRAE